MCTSVSLPVSLSCHLEDDVVVGRYSFFQEFRILGTAPMVFSSLFRTIRSRKRPDESVAVVRSCVVFPSFPRRDVVASSLLVCWMGDSSSAPKRLV